MITRTFKGGCLCGALRWQADRAPDYMGLCCCADCRKASGAGFIPFMGFPAAALTVTGPTVVLPLLRHVRPAGRVGPARMCS